MRTSHIYYLYQRYFARWCDDITTRFETRTRKWKFGWVMLFELLFSLVLLAGVITGLHFLGFIIGGPLIFLAMLITAMVVGSCTYDYNYGSALDDRRLNRVSKLLHQYGPMHVVMLLNQYTRVTHDYMDSKDLTQLLTAYPNRDKFIVANNIVALPGQPMNNMVPVPVDDDYVVGYHTLYRRLQAIRTHPELLHVPDGLIDDMYTNR